MTAKKMEFDELAWRIMLQNAEYDELDRIFAINGVLYEGHFNDLSEDEQDDIIKRLAIGIQTFNAQAEHEARKRRDWRRLPDVKVSGNEES